MGYLLYVITTLCDYVTGYKRSGDRMIASLSNN